MKMSKELDIIFGFIGWEYGKNLSREFDEDMTFKHKFCRKVFSFL